MSLEHILLGILDRPATGYEIKSDFDKVFSHFWSAELSQIYRTLKSLEKRGYLTSQVEPSDKGPARRVYRRTASGRSLLLEWLGAEPRIGGVRVPYLAQLFYLAELDDLEQSAAVVRKIRDQAATKLALLEGVEDEWRQDDPGYPNCDDLGDFHAQLVLEHGLRRMRATVEWGDAALARVEVRLQRRGAEQKEMGS